MHIMTKDGWKQLSPREFAKEGHTPTLLERMGITPEYNGAKAMADYGDVWGGAVMHVNLRKPNILQDMRASAQGRDLRNRAANGALSAKRWREGKRRYPYSSERQETRKQRK